MSSELSSGQIALGLLACVGVGGGALAGMTIAGGLYSDAPSAAPASVVPKMVARTTQSTAAFAAQSAARMPTPLRDVRVTVRAPLRPARHHRQHRASTSVPAIVPAVALRVTPSPARVRPVAQAALGATSATRVPPAPTRAPTRISTPPRSDPVISAPIARRPAPAPAPVRAPTPTPKPRAIGAFDDSG
jgi:hypothetical protein